MDKFFHLLKISRTAPRWVIFILDLSICAFAIAYANLLRFNFDFSALNSKLLLFQIVSVTLINSFFFKIFHTYEGIIRLSSISEGFRCISAIFFSFFILFINNLIGSIFNFPYLIPTSVIFIYFFLASFLIFGYRIIIKNLYRRSLKLRAEIKNVLIVGGVQHGTIIKNAMEQIDEHQYNIIGFIEENKNFWGKMIDDIRVYSFDQIKSSAKIYDINLLFLADENLEIDFKNRIVDFCLINNIQVKIIPPVQSWIRGQLNISQIKDIKIENLLNRPAIQLATDHVQKFIVNKRILITGAAGSIGSEIARQIAIIDPLMIILFDQNETGLYEIEYEIEKILGKKESTVVYIGDIRDKKAMDCLFDSYKPQVVFHAAAYKHVPLMESNPSEAILNNVYGTRLLAELAKNYDVDRFVFVSTDKAINPTNVMGASKRIAEMYIEALQNYHKKFIIDSEGNFSIQNWPPEQEHNTKFIITRFGNVLGSNGSVVPRFKEQINNGGPITITHPDVIRYFMTIPEACSLVLEAGTMGKGGEIFIFDMGEPVKIVDLAEKMIRLSGFIPNQDIQIKFIGLRPGEKLYEELLNKKEEVIPTHHKKIMIAKSEYQDFETISINIDLIIKLAQEHKKDQLVRQMKLIIPDYKSNNSCFEVLDRELLKSSELSTN